MIKLNTCFWNKLQNFSRKWPMEHFICSIKYIQNITSAISSADGSWLSRNHWKNVRLGPCRLFLLAGSPWLCCAFLTKSMPSFHSIGVEFEAGSPKKEWYMLIYCLVMGTICAVSDSPHSSITMALLLDTHTLISTHTHTHACSPACTHTNCN